ncbi:DUF3718 domain-containing protein [Thalassotalea sp. LPB0316]|uniref:DUF3718 domain-containing protein n=1 Tax=Thalassotalea sp. LPB0316 TaxID=2769490 RepID=UPI001867CF3D|nr:DUF3718 domain-containing protein [Thalassotalea sp. LPB0316]QOL25149.1 DUF3718 domain-containing protein [Thalassotalea sp. LPB0316]
MAKLIKSVATLSATIGALMFSSISAADMQPQLERALVKTCEAAMSDKPIKLKVAMDDYDLNERDVALGVMCNNVDIITFAEQHGAYQTAQRLQNSIGNVNIIDVAALSKVNVNF